MKIEPDTKLDFSSVLIRPKRFTIFLKRGHLEREFVLCIVKVFGKEYPSWYSMDTVGTVEMLEHVS